MSDEELNRIEQVDKLFPMPEYVVWFEKFPAREYVFVAASFAAIGLIMTIMEMEWIYRAVPGFISGTMVVFGGALHLPAFILKRSVEKKRRKYLLQ